MKIQSSQVYWFVPLYRCPMIKLRCKICQDFWQRFFTLTLSIYVETLRFRVVHLHSDQIIIFSVQQLQSHLLRVEGTEVDLVMLICGHYGVERWNSFLTRVSVTPAVILRAVDQVHVTANVNIRKIKKNLKMKSKK